jgi:kynurenine formamidase
MCSHDVDRELDRTVALLSRQISGIGVDTLSLDPGLDVSYAAHKAWLGTGKWGVELVANLREVPPVGATVFVAPSRSGARRVDRCG